MLNADLAHSFESRKTASLAQLGVCFALPRLLPDYGGVIVGGSANTALTLGMAMVRYGAQVDILAPVPSDRVGFLSNNAASSLITPLIYRRSGHLGISEGLRSLSLLIQTLVRRRSTFDVVHSHSGTFPYALVSLMCCRVQARIHSLYCPLGGKGGAYSHWWDQSFFARAVLQHIDALIAVSENVRRSLDKAGLSGQGLVLLPMCVDTTLFSPRPDHKRAEHFSVEEGVGRILFVGNASNEKGLLNLVDSLSILAAQGLRPRVVATLENANSVDEHNRTLGFVKARLSALALDDRVRFLGLIRDMPGLYAETDVVVIPWVTTRGPSDIPMVALEAMAMGKCVVSTPVGGCVELLRGGKAGLLTSDFSPESLARTLKDALESETLRRQVGDAAQRVADEFSADNLARKMIALYRDILNRKRSHAR